MKHSCRMLHFLRLLDEKKVVPILNLFIFLFILYDKQKELQNELCRITQ